MLSSTYPKTKVSFANYTKKTGVCNLELNIQKKLFANPNQNYIFVTK